MKLVRFRSSNGDFWGEFEPEGIVPLVGNPFRTFHRDSTFYQHGEVRLLAPVVPGKIVCVGLNYRDHVTESKTSDEPPDEPMLFLKPPSSIIGPGGSIVLPASSSRVDFEGELGIVIGQTCRGISEVEADEFIYGITCANDVTARDFQRQDKQWGRAKGFDTFCPVGPWVCVGEDHRRLVIETLVDMELKQRACVDDMIFSPTELVSFISSIMTLYPGDLILTGTPGGAGPLKPGSKVEVRIENIGSLVNDVVAGE